MVGQFLCVVQGDQSQPDLCCNCVFMVQSLDSAIVDCGRSSGWGDLNANTVTCFSFLFFFFLSLKCDHVSKLHAFMSSFSTVVQHDLFWFIPKKPLDHWSGVAVKHTAHAHH